MNTRWTALAVACWLSLLGCASGPDSGPAGAEARTQEIADHFMKALTELLGVAFTGAAVYQVEPGPPWEGAHLHAVVRDAQATEIRVPFTVDEDRSRTWILSRRERGLHLLHDHRYPDGTPHTLTEYGGYMSAGSIEDGIIRVSFPADEATAEMLPEASTNVWTFIIDPAAGTLVYDLTRHGRPRFRAELRRE